MQISLSWLQPARLKLFHARIVSIMLTSPNFVLTFETFMLDCPDWEKIFTLFVSGFLARVINSPPRVWIWKKKYVSTKGQLISKCLFGVIVWTKNQRKNYQNFCPIEAKTEILVIFSLVFCPNDDTKKTFWN